MKGREGKIFQHPEKDEYGKIGYGDPCEILQKGEELVSHVRSGFLFDRHLHDLSQYIVLREGDVILRIGRSHPPPGIVELLRNDEEHLVVGDRCYAAVDITDHAELVF